MRVLTVLRIHAVQARSLVGLAAADEDLAGATFCAAGPNAKAPNDNYLATS